MIANRLVKQNESKAVVDARRIAQQRGSLRSSFRLTQIVAIAAGARRRRGVVWQRFVRRVDAHSALPIEKKRQYRCAHITSRFARPSVAVGSVAAPVVGRIGARRVAHVAGARQVLGRARKQAKQQAPRSASQRCAACRHSDARRKPMRSQRQPEARDAAAHAERHVERVAQKHLQSAQLTLEKNFKCVDAGACEQNAKTVPKEHSEHRARAVQLVATPLRAPW